ncbi:MAG: tetratricopeptide repeat protein [Promethearchaeota archaeon]
MSEIGNINKILDKVLMIGRTGKNEIILDDLDKVLEDDPINIIAFYLKSVIYKKLGKHNKHSYYVKKARNLSHIQKKEDILDTLRQIDICLEIYSYELEGLYLRGLLIAKLREICEDVEYILYLKRYINILEEAINYHDKLSESGLEYRLLWGKMGINVKINDKSEITSKFCSDKPIILFRYASIIHWWMYDYIALYLDNLLEKNNKNACILNNKGITLLRKLHKDNEAVEYFNTALKIEPENMCALNNIGVLTESIEYFDEVLELDDLNLVANFNKSFALYKKGTYDDKRPTKESLKYCERALKINPNDASCLFLLGNIHKVLGNNEIAINSLDSALKFAPNNVYILESQANIFAEMGKYTLALKNFDRITELEPGDMNIWEEKVSFYKKLNDLEGEFNCYENMIKISPEYTEAVVGKGGMLVDRGKYDEAIKLLDQVEGMINWDNLWSLALFHKARAAALQNNKKEAFQLLEESIRAGAVFDDFSGELEIKKLIKESSDFDKYKGLEEFKSILAHDYNTKYESDKFWSKY